jgi:hypothetical protein
VTAVRSIPSFKGIVLDAPEKASNCGVVELALERGHIHLAEGKDHTCGRNRIVFGCALTNAAVADPKLLRSKKVAQPAWHRFTARHHAAVDVRSAENLLIVNIADIYVVANRNSGDQPCRNVTIQNNITRSHGIHIAGAPALGNIIKDNEHIGGGGKLTDEAKAKLEGNKGYAGQQSGPVLSGRVNRSGTRSVN